MTTLLLVLLIIVSIPGCYLEYFLLLGLRDKLGGPKFILLIAVYLLFLGFAVQLLTEESINFLIFLLLNFLTQCSALYYLKRELKQDIKRLLEKMRSSE